MLDLWRFDVCEDWEVMLLYIKTGQTVNRRPFAGFRVESWGALYVFGSWMSFFAEAGPTVPPSTVGRVQMPMRG